MKFDNKNKNSIQSLFNKIAKNYDLINEFISFGLHRSIKTSAVKRVLKKYNDTPENILDLCTGTGDIAIIFKKLSPKSQIIGIDFSEKMLSIAKKRAHDITFIKEDISEPLLTENFNEKYDICFISFGLRNLPDIDKFLENIKKLLKPNGILAILDLGKPVWFLRPYFFVHYNIFIPIIAKIFNRDVAPYKYFVNSAKNYPSQKEIIKKLKNHGFLKCQNKDYFLGIISLQTCNNVNII